MGFRDVVVAVLSLAVGAGLGIKLNNGELKGRLSACTEIVQNITGGQATCVIEEGKVFVAADEARWELSGQRVK